MTNAPPPNGDPPPTGSPPPGPPPGSGGWSAKAIKESIRKKRVVIKSLGRIFIITLIILNYYNAFIL